MEMEEIRMTNLIGVGAECHFLRFYFCDPLLRQKEYRRGWCGDHCDAFAALLNALGYEWRFALDDTDHIWIEIYSKERLEWCSFEPSPESDCKRYDFNKFADRKSRYIIALDGTDSYQDITHRYQADKDVIQKRRDEHCISEQWVVDFLRAESKSKVGLCQ